MATTVRARCVNAQGVYAAGFYVTGFYASGFYASGFYAEVMLTGTPTRREASAEFCPAAPTAADI